MFDNTKGCGSGSGTSTGIREDEGEEEEEEEEEVGSLIARDTPAKSEHDDEDEDEDEDEDGGADEVTSHVSFLSAVTSERHTSGLFGSWYFRPERVPFGAARLRARLLSSYASYSSLSAGHSTYSTPVRTRLRL